jgi:hypothetical protein
MATLKYWFSKYSPTERLHLTLDTGFVEKLFEGQQSERNVWSHDEVLAGKADAAISSDFDGAVLTELYDALAAYRAGTLTPRDPEKSKKK